MKHEIEREIGPVQLTATYSEAFEILNRGTLNAIRKLAKMNQAT